MALRTPRLGIAATLLGALLLPTLAAATGAEWQRRVPPAVLHLSLTLDSARARESRRCWAAWDRAAVACQAHDPARRVLVDWARDLDGDLALAEAALACSCTANLDPALVQELARRTSRTGDAATRVRWHDARLRLLHRLATHGETGDVLGAAAEYVRVVDHEAPEQRARAVATLEALARTPSPLARLVIGEVLDAARNDADLALGAREPSMASLGSLAAGLRAARRARASDVLDACAPDGFGCAYALVAAGHLDVATYEEAMRERKQLDRQLLALAQSVAALPPPAPPPVDEPTPDVPTPGGPTRAVVTRGPVEAVGSLSREDGRRVAHRHRRELVFCYEEALRRRPDLEGMLIVAALVRPDGVVMSSSVQQTSFSGSEVGACVAQSMRRWTYRSTDGPTMLRYALTLERVRVSARRGR